MTLGEYFKDRSGIGILSSADYEGRVTSAIYSTPHVFDDGTVAFVMRKKLTHKNLESNPYAAFMFVEDGGGYRGVRLYLRKTGEEDDPELLARMSRRRLTPEEDKAKGPKFLVRFEVEKVLPLIGSGETGIALK